MKRIGLLQRFLIRKIQKKTDKSFLDEFETWGLWCRRGLRIGYKDFANTLGVPIWVLATEVLTSWAKENAKRIIDDSNFRRDLADFLIDKYIVAQKLDELDKLINRHHSK